MASKAAIYTMLFSTLLLVALMNVSIASASLTDGLVDHWTFDSATEPGADSAGSNNAGTLQNGASRTTTAKIGAGALSLDGSDDYMSVINDLSSTPLGGTGSLAFWIKTTQTGDDTMRQAPGVTGVESAGDGNDIFWGWLDASGRIGITVGDGAAAKSTSPVNDNNWHHVVLTRSSSTGNVEVYVDGVYNSYAVSAKPSMINSFSGIGMIRDTGGSHEYLSGTLDDVRVYNRVLSASDVTELYNYPCTMTGANCAFLDNVYCDGGAAKQDTGVCNTGTGVCYATTTTIDECPAGNALREYWTGISGTSVCELTYNTNYPNSPTGSNNPTIFEGPVNWANNYGTRFRGYVYPPQSGSYTFWISSDDNSELWLSTDENPLNKVKIASVPPYACGGWTNSRQWDKCSEQQSSPITLQAGEKYYIEVLHKEGGGGDNVAVGWELPNGMLERPIPGSRLSPYACIGTTEVCNGMDDDCDGQIDEGFGIDCALGWWKLDETSGTTASDSADGYDGTLVNSPTWTTGQVDGALDFDGTDDYVNIPDTSISNRIGSVNKLTVSAWAYADSWTSPDHNPIVWKGSTIGWGANYLFRIAVSDGNVNWGVTCGCSGEGWFSGGHVSTGEWHHYAMTFDGTTARAYIDGVEVASSTTCGSRTLNVMSGYPVKMGSADRGEYEGQKTHFDGKIDDVRIYGRALSLNEIREMFLAGGGVPKEVTIIAQKVACDNEADLPNWGAGGPDITSTTAQSFVDDTSKNCVYGQNWEFQWAYDPMDNPGDEAGEASGWTTFGPTSSSDGKAVTTMSFIPQDKNKIWVREVFKSPGYQEFSGENTNQPVSAEMYCYQDVFNYDNYDFIEKGYLSGTFYCVAFNAYTCGDGIKVDEEDCDDGNTNNNDACVMCMNATCGDGYLWTGTEECDDGNNLDGDGCDANCVVEYCGDGIVNNGPPGGPGEECDPPGFYSNSTDPFSSQFCDSTCHWQTPDCVTRASITAHVKINNRNADKGPVENAEVVMLTKSQIWNDLGCKNLLDAECVWAGLDSNLIPNAQIVTTDGTGYALAYSLASDPQGWAVFIRAEGAKVAVDGAEYNIFYGKKLLDGIANTDCAPYRNFQINADITTATGSQKNNPKDFITGFLTFLSSLFSF